MTWAYTGNPASSTKDAIRFLVSDVDADEKLVQDEEITWAISQEANVWLAAALICDHLAAHFARLPDAEGVQGTSTSNAARAQRFRDQAQDLRARKGRAIETPTAGGIEQAERDAHRDDRTLIPRLFRQGMHDNPPGLHPLDEEE